MTRLGDQLDEIGRELDLLIAGHDNRRVIAELETAIDELEPVCAALVLTSKRRDTLRGSPREFQLEKFNEEERTLRLGLRERLSALEKTRQEDPASVRQRGNVSEMCQSALEYRKCVDKNSSSSWDAWRQSLERQFLIAAPQLESIRNVLDYAEAIARYKQEAERFKEFSRSIPENGTLLKELKDLAGRLKKIKEGFVFNLPRKVVAFYDLLDRDGHFPLERLDPEVSKWLADNDGFKDLTIVRHATNR